MVIMKRFQNAGFVLALALLLGSHKYGNRIAAAPPVSADSAKRANEIERLIRGLDDDDFEVRERSERELIKTVKTALDRMREATRNPSHEVRFRVNRALNRILQGRLVLDQALRWRAIRAYLNESDETKAVEALRRAFDEPDQPRLAGMIVAAEPAKRLFVVGDRIEFKATAECKIPAALWNADLTVRFSMISFNQDFGKIDCAVQSYSRRSDPVPIQSIVVGKDETATKGRHDVIFVLSARQASNENYVLLDATSFTYNVVPPFNRIERLVLSVDGARNFQHTTRLNLTSVTNHDSDMLLSRALEITSVDARTIRIRARDAGVTFVTLVDQNGRKDRIAVIVERKRIPLHAQ